MWPLYCHMAATNSIGLSSMEPLCHRFIFLHLHLCLQVMNSKKRKSLSVNIIMLLVFQERENFSLMNWIIKYRYEMIFRHIWQHSTLQTELNKWIFCWFSLLITIIIIIKSLVSLAKQGWILNTVFLFPVFPKFYHLYPSNFSSFIFLLNCCYPVGRFPILTVSLYPLHNSTLQFIM